MSLASRVYYLAIPALILLHLMVAPYTKVEESFNIQAIHDILSYGIPFRDAEAKFKAWFDHAEFPGSVPRTFVGALAVAALSKPLVWLGGLNGLVEQMTARAALGTLNAAALLVYVRSIRRAYGTRTAVWYTFLQASQFHILFYASRTLPNTFSFFLTTLALSMFLPNPKSSGEYRADQVTRLRVGIALLAFAAVVFRSEIVLLVATTAAWTMFRIVLSGSIEDLLAYVIIDLMVSLLIGGTVSILITVLIDSHFWNSGRTVWPELEAFIYNVFPQGHDGASAWGTSPWHWYFTSAIPRLVSAPSLLLLPYGLLFTTQRRPILDALVPSIGYVAIYSVLPHKETRFLFPIVPSLTLATAHAASYLSLRRGQISKAITAFFVLATAMTGFISHVILLPLSAQSYPGGHALQALHSHHASHHLSTSSTPPSEIHVHITNLALQSGVTRFLEQPPPHAHSHDHPPPRWIYDKSATPNTTADAAFFTAFDYLILEPSSASSLLHYESESPSDTPVYSTVVSVPSLRTSRPRVLRSTDNRGCLALCATRTARPDGMRELLRLMYGAQVAWVYAAVHDVLREGSLVGVSVTRGYWVDWGVEEKLVVLRNEMRMGQGV